MSFAHTFIALLDPLEASALLRQLPSLNRDGNVEGLVQLLRGLCEKASRSEWWDPEQAAAAMRDLGMCLGSLKHHGYEPLELVPLLEPVLRRLGERTGLPPRDTLLPEWRTGDKARAGSTLERAATRHSLGCQRLVRPGGDRARLERPRHHRLLQHVVRGGL